VTEELGCYDVKLDGTTDVASVIDALSLTGAEVLQLESDPDTLFVLDVSERVLETTLGVQTFLKVDRV
jgi:hypothetical protein